MKKKIETYAHPYVPDIGMYEMAKNIFDTALVKKIVEKNEKTHRRLEKKEKDHYLNPVKDDKYNKLDTALNKHKSMNKETKLKRKTHINMSEAYPHNKHILYADKYFKSSTNSKHKNSKEELLLPLINYDMYAYNNLPLERKTKK